jgi:hypothetical protein
MSRLPRFRSATLAVGLEIVPPTLLVAMDHPWMGTATLAAVLASSITHSRMRLRSAQERHQAILSYAQAAASMGSDPATVINALRGTRYDLDDPDDDESPIELSRALENGRRLPSPWLHLPHGT